MTHEWRAGEVNEAGLAVVAAYLALIAGPGDVVALRGDLGAGKTTFARELLRALSDGRITEVPSPTFSLLQTYETGRLTVHHLDCYRMRSAAELAELGFEELAASGLVLMEWPERVEGLLPADRLDVVLADGATSELRLLSLVGTGAFAARLARLEAMHGFASGAGWAGILPDFLQGDASSRAYSRLRTGDRRAILMDSPRRPDGPPIRNGKSYSAIAHLAEDVGAFVAVASALRGLGLSAPAIEAADLGRGFLLIEDLGDRVFSRQIASGVPIADLYRPAVELLVELRRHRLAPELPIPGGGTHHVAHYDQDALGIEIELMTDWYWCAAKGGTVPADALAMFLGHWRPLLESVSTIEDGWVLRDFHSPNLISQPEREGLRQVGLIDFQDAMRGHPAYDLVSLLQDARLTVPAATEQALLDHYCRLSAAGGAFDPAQFRFAYAILGAQRNTKILGIFARLSMRDGKHGYLAHIPRIWEYLVRDLAHPGLGELRSWYDTSFPVAIRTLQIGNR